jgi:hypothetical protein
MIHLTRKTRKCKNKTRKCNSKTKKQMGGVRKHRQTTKLSKTNRTIKLVKDEYFPMNFIPRKRPQVPNKQPL